MQITSNFDSGNIRIVEATEPSNIQLEIKPDNQSEFFQWFHFKLHNNNRCEHILHINNAAQSSYVEGWEQYQAVASYDRQTWFRVPTTYNGEQLTITLTPEYDAVYFAYFCPYSYERHQDLLHSAQLSDNCQLDILGQTIDGRDISLLIVGEPDREKKKVWITARQHPGETMAEWFTEGLIDRLLDSDDGVARSLLNNTVFYIVPNMNPDGSVRGHLRTNSLGVNLNREWQTPTMENSPEVYLVREKMLATGVDLFLDVHGDEALPYNFLSGSEGIPSYDERLKNLEDKFKKILLAITPEFQNDKGYEKDAPGKANLTLASNWVGEQFKCLSYTIEMPFKDNELLPEPNFGWSNERSRFLGQDFLTAIHHVSDGI